MICYNIKFEPAKLHISISTNCEYIKAYCSNVYTNMLVEAVNVNNLVKILRKTEDKYLIEYNQQQENEKNLDEVLTWLNRTIKKGFIIDKYWPMHCGMVVDKDNKGHAILLCGKSGSGKTTLCTYFLVNEYLCPTDDLVWIDKDSMLLSPMSTSINLRDDVLNVFDSQLSLKYSFSDTGEKTRWVMPTLPITHKVSIKAIVNVNYNDKSSFIKRLDTMAALKLILTNSYSSKNMIFNYEMASKIVKTIPIYEIFYTSVEEAKKLILENVLD